MAEAGFVSLVGAGPGDPDLITRKGAERIERADVLIHDQLVAPPSLMLAGARCEVVHRRDIGDQDAINEFMIAEARKGKRIVRLKGGDPFVFGRGAEEIEALAAAGVRFEVIPGVTSGVGVPAYAGIPLTHRAHASAVTFVTGHEDPNKSGSAVRWEKLVQTGGTLVVFMGVRRLPGIVESLLQAGAAPDTPVAAVQWGTTPMQRTVRGDLADIVDRVRSVGLDHPALVIVGEVVRSRETHAWFDRRPLWGRRVLVTRARTQASTLIQALREVGAGVITMPVLDFAPPSDPSGLAPAIQEMSAGRYDWVIFTSANAVRAFATALDEAQLDLRAFASARIAAVGPATSEALAERGIRPDLVPEQHRAEGLLDALAGMGTMVQQRFLLPRAEVARSALPDTLRASGAAVDVLSVYRTICPEISTESAHHHVELADTITFTSPSSVQNLIRLCGDSAMTLLGARKLCAIGPITARAIERAGLQSYIVAPIPTVQHLVRAIVEDVG